MALDDCNAPYNRENQPGTILNYEETSDNVSNKFVVYFWIYVVILVLFVILHMIRCTVVIILHLPDKCKLCCRKNDKIVS